MTSNDGNPWPGADLGWPTARGGAADTGERGLPRWKQIEATLIDEIRARRFAASGRLPSEAELAQRFDVNRHTVRQALASLAHAGLISVQQGKGAFVEQDWVDYTLARRTRFSENIEGNRRRPSKQLLGARELPAPERIAALLKIDAGEPVMMIELLDEAADQPIALATLYLPALRFPRLLDHIGGVGEDLRITAVLAAQGVVDYSRAANRITAHLPTEEQARLLRQARARPVLCVESVDVDVAGVPIKAGDTVFSADRVQLVVDSSGPS